MGSELQALLKGAQLEPQSPGIRENVEGQLSGKLDLVQASPLRIHRLNIVQTTVPNLADELTKPHPKLARPRLHNAPNPKLAERVPQSEPDARSKFPGPHTQSPSRRLHTLNPCSQDLTHSLLYSGWSNVCPPLWAPPGTSPWRSPRMSSSAAPREWLPPGSSACAM
jgi:hypothetical protein